MKSQCFLSRQDVLGGPDYKVFISLKKIKGRRGIEEKANDPMREQILTGVSKKI